MSEDFPAHLARFRPGSLLAGYRLEVPVGSGGMAVVFRARDERLDRRLVAVKILDPALASDPEFRERFIAEAGAAAAVDDPHIIPIHEAGEADGVLFIAMRLVQGGDLRKVLEREGVLPPERAAEFISPVASALDAAHAAGLVHRDVKPANILVDARAGRPDHVYLSDFGIAKAAASEVTLTEPGMLMGTPDYSAPEQLDGLPVDGRADQYALACVAYRLLTGTVPFERDQLIAVMVAHLHAQPPSLTARRPDLPGAADKVLAKAMAKAPDQRYESCGDFAEALREALGVAPYRPGRSATGLAPPQPAGTPSGSAARPLDGPTLADGWAPTGAAAPPGSMRSGLAELDELYRAWQGSVRRAARPRITARRRRQAWLAGVVSGAFFVAALAVILVAVTRHPAKPSNAGNAGNTGNTGSPVSASAFAGYPGQQGMVTVSSITVASGAPLAVGSADGHPAIWRRDASGAWTLVSAASPAVKALLGTLNSIALGPKGWIAVGDAGSGAVQQPVAVISANGGTWQVLPSMAQLPGMDPAVTGVAADRNAYVVVGTRVSTYKSRRPVATMWWSTDLQRWHQGQEIKGRLDGRVNASAVDAVAATIPAGFVAAGTHDTGGLIGISVDGGQEWSLYGVTPPAHASAVVLRLVAVNGNRVVAAGYAVTAGGDIPIVAYPADGGQHWRTIALGPSGGQGTVTALTAVGSGFIAAGQAGPAGAQQAVTWSSPDGLRWSVPASRGTRELTALSATGPMVTGAARQGAAAFVDTFPAP